MLPDSGLKTGSVTNRGQFQKGVSGNPGGRRRQPEEVKEMLKEATVPALRLLVSTVNNPRARLALRIRAAETILDRALGKPAQPIEADINAMAIVAKDPYSELTVEELRNLARLAGEKEC